VEIVDSTVIKDHSVVGGEVRVLKILMFATNGEKDTFKDNGINYFI